MYWHCKSRQNKNVALIAVSLSAVICVPFPGINLHFSLVLVTRLWGVAVKSSLVAKWCAVISSRNTFVFTTSSKFKVAYYLKSKLLVTLAFSVVLLVCFLQLFLVLLVCLCLHLDTFDICGVVLWSNTNFLILLELWIFCVSCLSCCLPKIFCLEWHDDIIMNNSSFIASQTTLGSNLPSTVPILCGQLLMI